MRRVRSNIEDESAFARTVKYIPKEAAFQSADPDLLKLLIKPLYGNYPQVGIRELIQNAVDAVRELEEYKKKRTDLKDRRAPQQTDVVIRIENSADGRRWLTVTDRGLGMTAETICNYFLTAGASYRRSDAWRKQFENKKGEARVLRSGRFGVGVLATFLLGSEIHVSTRHIDSLTDQGIEFTANLDTDTVELRKVRRPVGTEVRVCIDQRVVEQLNNNDVWDWYCLSTPSVQRFAESAKTPLRQKYTLPQPHKVMPPSWHEVRTSGLREIHWTYSDAPSLTCNGIVIKDQKEEYKPKAYRWKRTDNEALRLLIPHVSVFDPDGKLPLNLQRTELTEAKYPFSDELAEDVAKDFFAYALLYAPSKQLGSPGTKKVYYECAYPGLDRMTWHDFPVVQWFSSKGGLSLVDPWNVTEGCISSALVIPQYSSKGAADIGTCGSDATFGSLIGTTLSYHGYPQWIRWILGGGRRQYQGADDFLDTTGRSVVLLKSIATRLKDHKDIGTMLLSRINEESINANWIVWRIGTCSNAIDLRLVADSLAKLKKSASPRMIGQLYLEPRAPEVPRSPIAKLWKKSIGRPLIPFDPTERMRALGRSYRLLQSYIQAHKLVAEASHGKKVVGRS